MHAFCVGLSMRAIRHDVFSAFDLDSDEPNNDSVRCASCVLLDRHIPDHVMLALLLMTRHVSAPPQCPCMPCLLLVVPLLLHPSLNVSLLLPRRSPRCQTGNRHQCPSPRPPSLACATKPCVNVTHVKLDASFLRPLFGSAHCWTQRLLDMGVIEPFS